ncbi:MAG: cation-translocating P-type ATPase [Selenomonadaceae bacterium]|nr:cation-translocating P-type ATPase [Selenomonadaceae bacterium]
MKKSLPIKYLILLDIVLSCGMTAYLISDDISVLSALDILLTIFIAACPLPLALAAPLALWLGKRRGRRQNILFRRGQSLAVLCQVNTLVLGKNGTITDGAPYITDLVPEGVSQGHLLALAASAEQNSSHPVAKAIYNTALDRHLRLQRISACNEIPGCGVEAIMGGNPVRVGSAQWIQREGFKMTASLLTKIDQLAYHGKMTTLVTNGKYTRGLIALEDNIRPETTSAIHRLQRQGLKVMMLTGDSQRTAAAIKRLTEIDDVRSDLTPEQKAREIQLMRAKGQVVAMAGNMARDQEVFAVADLAVEIVNSAPPAENNSPLPTNWYEPPEGQAEIAAAPMEENLPEAPAETAEELPPKNNQPPLTASAHVADLSLPNGLGDLLPALHLARQAQKIVKQNKRVAYLTWLLVIPPTLGALAPLGLPYPSLEMVVGAVAVSSGIILLNSLRMR